jgi:hypothetical protein
MTSYAQSKEQVYWLGSTTGLTGQVQPAHPTGRHQSDRCPWPVRLVKSSQSTKQMVYMLFGPEWLGRGCKSA